MCLRIRSNHSATSGTVGQVADARIPSGRTDVIAPGKLEQNYALGCGPSNASDHSLRARIRPPPRTTKGAANAGQGSKAAGLVTTSLWLVRRADPKLYPVLPASEPPGRRDHGVSQAELSSKCPGSEFGPGHARTDLFEGDIPGS